MIRLLKIEYRKNFRYPAFWIILGLHYFFLISFLLNINNFSGSFNYSTSEIQQQLDLSDIRIFEFPDLWQNLAYMAGFFKILLGIFLVIAVTNEFQYNTIRLNLTNGLTRMQFLISKFLLGFLISVFSTIILFGLALFIGLVKNQSNLDGPVMDQSQYLLTYFIEILFYLMMAILFGIWLKRTGIAIFILLIYPLLIEPLIRWQVPDYIDKFFPVKAMDNLNVFPFQKYVGMAAQTSIPVDSLLVTLLWIGLMFLLSWWVMERRDL